MASPPATGGQPDRGFIDVIAPLARLLRTYGRAQVEGLANVPAGGAVLAANHTGWLGLDYVLLFLTLYDHLDRVPRAAVHPSWFRLPLLKDHAHRLGLFEVSVKTGVDLLSAGELVVFFPEAEEGNFKPVWKHYELADFKPGFARVALAAEVPVVPTVIVGGEEANPSLGALDTRDAIGMKLPLPVNVLPFPAKWRIAFLPAIPVGRFLTADAVDQDPADLLVREVRGAIERGLGEQLGKRGHPFL